MTPVRTVNGHAAKLQRLKIISLTGEAMSYDLRDIFDSFERVVWASVMGYASFRGKIVFSSFPITSPALQLLVLSFIQVDLRILLWQVKRSGCLTMQLKIT
jgi:hypothetical protein